MSKERQIRESIQKIAWSRHQSGGYLTAQVKSVEGETCTVLWGDLEISDVMLTPLVDEDTNKILITPSEGSTVLLADFGDKRDLQVIGWSLIDSITINGGKLGGLIKIEELTNKLNGLTNKVNSLINQYNTHTHQVSTAGTATAQKGMASAVMTQASKADTFSSSDYEDDKIKH